MDLYFIFFLIRAIIVSGSLREQRWRNGPLWYGSFYKICTYDPYPIANKSPYEVDANEIRVTDPDEKEEYK